MNSIGFIGGGRITKIFLHAFQKSNTNISTIKVFDTNLSAIAALKEKFGHITLAESAEEAAQTDLVFIALHPPVIMEVLQKLQPVLKKDTVVISLAPKITIEKMRNALGGFSNIARMNPSASTIVCKGVNPVTFSAEMPGAAKQTLLQFFNKLGYTPEVEEHKIEAYAVISAMGHTYFFFQLQKLKEIAKTFGMDEKESQKAIAEMLNGSTETLFNSVFDYKEVSDLVPVRPLAEVESTIEGYYDQYLTAIFNKIKPA